MIDLAGRTALVTGAAGGIGFGIAKVLATAGARVVVNDVDATAAARAAAALGDRVVAVQGDVSDEQSVEAIMAAPAAEGVDILVNNAGIFETLAPIAKQSPEEWGRVIDVNLRGAYLMSRAVAPHDASTRVRVDRQHRFSRGPDRLSGFARLWRFEGRFGHAYEDARLRTRPFQRSRERGGPRGH